MMTNINSHLEYNRIEENDKIIVPEEIRCKSKSILQTLRALKEKYDTPNAESSMIFDDKNRVCIKVGISKAEELIILATHLEQVEAEKRYLQLMNLRLRQENILLREQLLYTEEKYQKAELSVVQLEEDINDLKFKCSLHTNKDTSHNNNDIDTQDFIAEILSDETDCEGINDTFIIASNHSERSDKTFSISPNPLCENKSSQDFITELSSKEENSEGLNKTFSIDQKGQIVPSYNTQCIKNKDTQHYVRANLSDEEDCKRTNDSFIFAPNALYKWEINNGSKYYAFEATKFSSLAWACRFQGDFKQAIELLNIALTLRIRIFGEYHSAVAAILTQLTEIYFKQKKYENAEPLCKRTLKITETVLGKFHENVVRQIYNLNRIYYYQKKKAEYDECYNQLFHKFLSVKVKTYEKEITALNRYQRLSLSKQNGNSV